MYTFGIVNIVRKVWGECENEWAYIIHLRMHDSVRGIGVVLEVSEYDFGDLCNFDLMLSDYGSALAGVVLARIFKKTDNSWENQLTLIRSNCGDLIKEGMMLIFVCLFVLFICLVINRLF